MRVRIAILSAAALLMASVSCDTATGPDPDAAGMTTQAPDAPALAMAATTQRGTFTSSPPPVPIIAACVDEDNPLRMLGSWSGWFTQTLAAGGHLHITEHVDWSDVEIVAADGRKWLPGPGAHESFSLNFDATDGGSVQRQIMHNLRARFNGPDGESDLQVWHTIHIVRGPAPDYDLRVFDVVLPFEARCIGR